MGAGEVAEVSSADGEGVDVIASFNGVTGFADGGEFGGHG